MSLLVTTRTWGEMIRFSHAIFALPFAMAATFLAGRHTESGLPAPGQAGLIVLCMVAARSFAMTFNRIVDAAYDARNPRTAGRPIPAGKITPGQAWVFSGASCVVFIAACAAFMVGYSNPWPLVLSLPTLVFLAAYSYAKRVTPAAHFFLGAAIAFAPMAAWIAVDPASLGGAAVALMGAALLWIAGFDIIYACQDVDVDRREGLFSIPARWGIARALWVSRGCHVLTVLLLIVLGRVAGLGWIYGVGVLVTAVLLTAEQAVVRPNDLSRVNLAFFTLNGCVSVVLAASAIADLLLVAPGP